MEERIREETELLRERFPDLVYRDRWIWLPCYRLTEGWNPADVPVAFFIRDGFPGISPYGIYVPAGIRFKGRVPSNYKEPAKPSPPFDGAWGVFSWEATSWQPSADPRKGHNLVNWVVGFIDRFKEGI